jgi:hypothetical protein
VANPGQSWAAATTLIAGVIQRLETPRAAAVHPALSSVLPGALAQVELMMIHEACQSLHAAGAPLTHDSVLAEIRKLEPGGAFGFACIVFENLWQKRPSLAVTDAEFDQAVAILTAPSQPAKLRLTKGGEEQVLEFGDIEAACAAAMQRVMAGYTVRVTDRQGVVKYAYPANPATQPPRPEVPSHRPSGDERSEPGARKPWWRFW